MKRFFVPVAIGALSCAGAHAGAPPPVPRAEYRLVDEPAATTAAAGTGWTGTDGTAPAALVPAGGGRAVRLPCNFKGTALERASWDRSVRLDLAGSRGVRFLFCCPDASPVSHFSFYLHSGRGWYAATFGPEAKDGWTTVTIEKTDTAIEGQPAGWGSIDALRISAWRGGGEDTEFYVANLGVLGADAPIVIVRGESVAASAPDEIASVNEFSKAVAQTLDGLGLPYAVLSDLDLSPARLRGRKIAILPHNPNMPEKVGRTLEEFVQGGGKVVSFYIGLPPGLSKAVGIVTGRHIRESHSGQFASIRAQGRELPGLPPVVRQASWNIIHAEPVEGRSRVAAYWYNGNGESTREPAIVASDRGVHMTHVLLADDPANKEALLLAMLGRLAPELFGQAASNRLDAVGRFGSFNGFDEFAKSVAPRASRNAAARAALDEAGRLRAEARRQLDARCFPEAIAAAGQAHEAAVRAWCAVQEPRPGREHRAWWCHSAFGPAGMEWDDAVRALATNGFTAVFPNMLWGGVAYYESRVLPVAPEVRERGDPLAKCVAACRKYGVECHVWKVNWNMGEATPRDFAERMKREGRTQVGFDGRPIERWLCPSHPDNRQLEIDAMAEVATRYDVDGIHFDYIRYPGPEGCFCAGCRARFEQVLGAKVAHWPADTRNDPAVRDKWLEFRRDNITAVVAGVSARVRPAKPKVRISAAVFPNWPIDRDEVGQDWKLWCERGYLDFVCPMDYTASESQFENQVRRQLEWAGKAACYPGIGLSVWGPRRDVVKLIDDIAAARRLGAPGFTIFQYDPPAAAQIAPLCGLGVTRAK